MRKGVDAYITKPFDAKELLVIIRNLIENRRALQEKFSKTEYSINRTNKHLSNPDKNFIKKVNDIIERHLAEENFNMEDMSKEINMSRSNIYRKLNALTGKSPSVYIRSIRLAKAKKMIVEDIGNISEIAYSVGFSSPAYFTKCFKDEFGISPSELRK